MPIHVCIRDLHLNFSVSCIAGSQKARYALAASDASVEVDLILNSQECEFNHTHDISERVIKRELPAQPTLTTSARPASVCRAPRPMAAIFTSVKCNDTVSLQSFADC